LVGERAGWLALSTISWRVAVDFLHVADAKHGDVVGRRARKEVRLAACDANEAEGMRSDLGAVFFFFFFASAARKDGAGADDHRRRAEAVARLRNRRRLMVSWGLPVGWIVTRLSRVSCFLWGWGSFLCFLRGFESELKWKCPDCVRLRGPTKTEDTEDTESTEGEEENQPWEKNEGMAIADGDCGFGEVFCAGGRLSLAGGFFGVLGREALRWRRSVVLWLCCDACMSRRSRRGCSCSFSRLLGSGAVEGGSGWIVSWRLWGSGGGGIESGQEGGRW